MHDRLQQLNESLAERVEIQAQERDRFWRLSQDLLIVTDAQGTVLNINPAWTIALGWTAEDLVGKTGEWLIHPEPTVNRRRVDKYHTFCRARKSWAAVATRADAASVGEPEAILISAKPPNMCQNRHGAGRRSNGSCSECLSPDHSAGSSRDFGSCVACSPSPGQPWPSTIPICRGRGCASHSRQPSLCLQSRPSLYRANGGCRWQRWCYYSALPCGGSQFPLRMIATGAQKSR